MCVPRSKHSIHITCWLCALLSLCVALGWVRASEQPPTKEPPAAEQKAEPKQAEEPKPDEPTPPKRRRPRRERDEVPDSALKNSPQVLAAFREAVAQAAQSTVSIEADGKRLCLGLIVSQDGLILTKASEIQPPAAEEKPDTSKPEKPADSPKKEEPAENTTAENTTAENKTAENKEEKPAKAAPLSLVCKLIDGRELPAQLVGLHEVCDLALLKVDAEKLKVATWSDGPPAVGDWVISPGPQAEPLAVGVVSVPPRHIGGQNAVLGIGVEDSEQGTKIVQIAPKSGALAAGLQVNDIILEVQGYPIENRVQLVEILGQYFSGDEVQLLVKRRTEELRLKATMGEPSRLGRGDMQNTMGGALSSRRLNFPRVLQHDTTLQPAQCGGPLVDLEGRVVGLNIARAGRVESYALPVDAVLVVLAELRTSRPSTDAERKLKTLQHEMEHAQQEIIRLKTELKQLQETKK